MNFSELFGFIGILRESLKILAQGRKIIAIITAIAIVLRSSLLVINIFSTKQVIHDLLGKQTLFILTGFNSPEFSNLLAEAKYDIHIILAVGLFVVLVSMVVSLFTVGATILVSATAYCGKRVSFLDLIPKLTNSFIKLLVTSFHVIIFGIGYIFCFSVMVFPLVLIYDNPFAFKATLISISIIASIFVTYLSIVWTLGMVISVIEDNCCGIEALGRAAVLVKGKKVHAFALNLILLLASVIVQVLISGKGAKSVSKQIIIGVFWISFASLVVVFQCVIYTVLYFQCKKIHGEEIELQGDWEYSKVALANEDIA